MRVGIDYRPALVNREGIGRYTRELVRGLIEHRFDANLGLFGYTFAAAKFTHAELGIEGTRAELLRLRIPSPWIDRITGWLKKGADDLVGGANVFHHTQPNLLPVREAIEVATIFDCIYMYDAGYLDPEAAARMTEQAKAMVARAKRILVPSQYVGAEVVMSLGAHPARVSTVELGCDHIARDLPVGGYPKADEPYLLTVSRVDARKNHLRILRAFERLVAEGFPQRWVIAGPQGYGCEDFLKALDQSPAKGRVEWRSFVAESELPKLYAQADLFLFPSLNEGFGLPPLEAMACGAPVVSSCVTSLPEVCGEAAFLVEPTDEDQIFAAASRILSEPDIAADLKLRGKAQARKFTWRETAKHTLLAYKAAVETADEEPQLRKSL